MAWQQFSNLSPGQEPVALFDTLTSQIAPCVIVPCTAAGTNAIVLTGTTDAPAITAYSDLVSFSFLAAATSTGTVTAQFAALPSLNVYFGDGLTQIGSGNIVSGQPYRLTWSQGLNAGAGGFYLDQWAAQPPSVAATAITHGYNAALNLQVNASATSGVLTVAVKDASTGNDPSSSNPVNISFRDTTNTGTLVQLNITSALSVNTNAIGATLGIQNNVAFSLWLAVLNNSGTAVLALINYPGATQVLETGLQSATGFTSGSTLSNTYYCPNGTTVTSQAFRILARLDFAANSNLSGAGFVAPTNIQLFGPTVFNPGLQTRVLLTSQTASNSASISDTTSFLTGFDQYEIVFENLVPASNSQNLLIQVQSGGTFQTATYVSDFVYFTSGGANDSSATNGIVLSCGALASQLNVQPGSNGYARVYQPAQTSSVKAWTTFFAFNVSANVAVGYSSGYWNGGTGAITGFNLLFASGNITSGVVKVYGLAP